MPQSKPINIPLTWICSQLFCSFLDLWRWWWLLRLDYFYFFSQLVELLSLFFPQESIVCFKLRNQICVLFDQMCVVAPVEMDVLQKLVLRNLRTKSLQLSRILFPPVTISWGTKAIKRLKEKLLKTTTFFASAMFSPTFDSLVWWQMLTSWWYAQMLTSQL